MPEALTGSHVVIVTLKVNDAGLDTSKGHIHLCRSGSITTEFSEMIRLWLH
jgi:hypothetical protein